MSAEMHCGGATPTPPGCDGTPDPTPWIAGPMTPRKAKEWNTCLPPGTQETSKKRGAQCSWPPKYKFLNSGLYAGRAGEVRSMLDAVLSLPRRLILNSMNTEDDQTAIVRVWRAQCCTKGAPYERGCCAVSPTAKGATFGCFRRTTRHAGNHSMALDYGASLFWSLSGIQGGTLHYHHRRDGMPPLIRPAWSEEAACFVHAAGR